MKKRDVGDPAGTRYVEQLMSRAVATCRPDDRLDAAARIMWEHDCGVVPVTVVEDGGERVVGMLTDRDVCMAAYTQGRPLWDIPATVAMSHVVRSCRPRDTIKSALAVMAAERIRRLPVLDERSDRLVGLLSLADVARQETRTHPGSSPGDLARTVEALSMSRPHDVVAA
jgi:CBS domain-containing protein